MNERSCPNYDRVVHVAELPRQVSRDSLKIEHGYAVELGGSIGECLVFFAHLEPALVFGRAGRMSSGDISSYGVFAAARELRFDERLRRDVVALHITGSNLDRQDDEAEAFRRWIAGTSLASSHYRPAR
jgi:hypothetical protein